MSRIIVVQGWERFQHYKDRDPPWVKLYRDLLTSESWVLGTDVSRLVQVASTLLAARYSNSIPYDFRLIRKVASLDCTEAEFDQAVAHLVAHKFLIVRGIPAENPPRSQVASTSLATCTSEAEAETEQRQSRAEQSQTRARGPEHDDELVQVPRGTLAKIRDCYPPGLYGDNDWLLAEREISGRLAQGTTPVDLVAAAAAYCAQQGAIGKVGTQYITAPSKFFARAGKWRGPFPLPAKPETAMDRLQRLSAAPTDNRVLEHEQEFGRFIANG